MIRRVVLASCMVLFVLGGRAAAQPQVALSTTVVSPGQSLTVTVTGGPGQFYAVVGSSVNGGASYAGVPLGVGADAVILSIGTLSGNGTAVVPVTPPFNGTILDRYYVQAATSTSPNFVPLLQLSAVGVIRNGDLVVGLTGPTGPQGFPGPQGPVGPAGPQGASGLSNVTTVNATGTVGANATSGGAMATCPAGTRVIGGGAGGQNTTLRVYSSFPSGSTAWFAVYMRDTPAATSAFFQVYAICATVAP